MNIVDYYRSISWRLISDFGWRTDPFTKNRVHHNGIDFGIPEENRRNGPYHIPTLTPFIGKIHATGNYGDRGLTVVQRVAGTDVLAVYQHLHRIDVKKDQMLGKDNSVGLVGSTGRSTAVHLHFELRKYSSSALGSGLWGNPRNFQIPDSTSTDIETIVVDPGHGGDGKLTGYGTTGNGLTEKYLNLLVARHIRDYLLSNFVCKVVMTRNSDVDVSFADRATIARNAKASLLFSVHFNGYHVASANGFETFIYNGTLRPETINNQHDIHDAIFDLLSTYGIRNRGKKKANFAILRLPPTSCVLAEYGFITNPTEAALFKRPGMLEQLGEVTAEGIAKARNLKRRSVAPPAPPNLPPVEPPTGPLPALQRRIGVELDGVMSTEPGFLAELGGKFRTVGRFAFIISVCNRRLAEAGLPPIKMTGHGDHVKIKTK